eukprot:TRINITY_DN389_c0_g2_i6.p1 TRINITY_DN389_c0_g2~~TRINITY_DN389_c0_g2_i6.p1  ORF type:complete len:280 (+),score=38.40 TRINITY_DN389_c0_g2_i6:378-1217(+)
MFKKIKRLKKNFSLVELLIVIGIMGALTALILPQFQNAEDSAKDTGCDYNNAGTLRYVSMFKAANGVYPNGFHTGYAAAAGTQLDDADAVEATKYNMGAASELTAEEANSLCEAGITKLAYGTGLADTDVATGVFVCRSTTAWFEDTTSAGAGSAEVFINGKGIDELALAGGVTGNVTKDPAGVIVPLFAAPTIDWETAYNSDGSEKGDSVVNVALAGKCPWPADGKLRYYICFFKAYSSNDADGKPIPARLVGTACPECGSLNEGAFQSGYLIVLLSE